MGTVRTTLLAKICAMSVLAAARQGVDNRISAFALSLPIDEYYVQGCSIMDINSDGIPEVYLTANCCTGINKIQNARNCVVPGALIISCAVP